MKRILLFARDPGGANTIEPLITTLSNQYEVLLYAKDTALLRFEKAGFFVRSIARELEDFTQNAVAAWLSEKNPDFVITGTSADDNTEKFLWKACENKKIACFAILDQWMNYGIRFSKFGVSEIGEYEKKRIQEYLPTKICVMDAYAKEKMHEEGIPYERILITGQPHFEHIAESYAEITEEQLNAFREAHKIGADEKIFVYASEPISLIYQETDESCQKFGFTERTNFKIIKKLLNELSQEYGQKIRVIIRLHPKENTDNYNDLLQPSYHVVYETDQNTDNRILMKASSMIAGMSSMFLLEAVVCGKPVISVMIGDTGRASFILEDKGQIVIARNEVILRRQLEQWLKGKERVPDMEVPENSVERIIENMEEYL